MASQATGKIPSGVEPIDRVLSGLERGQCHLIVGRPGSGKTTLGAQFLIAGLNNNERVVIFTRLSAQEIVSRFEPLGYDYFAHVPKGSESNDRLIIFEQSDEIVEQIKKLDDFSLVTQELEETLKEHRPARVVFDPASYLIEAGSPRARESRARALIDLSNKFHTTSILIIDDVSDEGIVGPLSEICSSVTYLNSKTGESGTSILDFAKVDDVAVHKPEVLVSVSRTKGLTTAEALPAPKPVAPAPKPVIAPPPPQPVAPAPTELFDTQTGYNPPHPSLTPIKTGTQPLPSIELETPHEQKFHVLVIDDDPATCNLITRALRQDCDVTAVNDGASGLKKLSHNNYDLIILDVNLPVVDGFHICQHIRKTQWQVPIIIVTGTHLRAEDRLHSASAGGDLYLTKPFSVHELRLRVRQMIGRYRNVPEWVGAGAGIGLEPAISESVSPEPEEQFVGYDAFVQRLSRHTERARAVGLPFSIVGCTIATNGNGSNKMSRMVDAVRYQIRERDVMTVTPEHQSFVLLSEANVDGVQVFVQRLRQSIQAEVGSEPLIQWRTYPIDGENAAELLTEVREELKNEVIAVEKESTSTIQPTELFTHRPSSHVPVAPVNDDMATFFVPPDPVVEVVEDSHQQHTAHIPEVHVPEAIEPAAEEPFFEFVIEEEEIIREGDSTLSNMAAHLPVSAHTGQHTDAIEIPKPPAEPVKELAPVPVAPAPAAKEDSLQEFSFEFRDSESEKTEHHDGTGVPSTTDEIKPHHTGDEHSSMMSESSFTGEIGSISQIISEADLKAATPHTLAPVEHIVETKVEPVIEVSHITQEPEFVPAVHETHTMPPMTHVPEPVIAAEPVSSAPALSTMIEASPASTSPASTWIPAASVPKLPESRVSTPAMWTETPRSTPPVENNADVPTFATFFDNSFEQYRQIVESLNKQPEPIAKPVRFEPSARESFLDFLAGRK